MNPIVSHKITRRFFLKGALACLAGMALGGAKMGEDACQAAEPSEPSRVGYEAAGILESGVEHVCALACQAERLYVAGEKQIGILTLSGESIKRIRLKERPVNIEASQDGKIWVVYPRRIEVLSPEGVVEEKWGFADSHTDLASVLCAGNRVYVGDSGCKRVRVLDRETRQELMQFGGRNTERGIRGLSPSGPYMDLFLSQEGLWVANTGRCQVELYDVSNGDLLNYWGEKGDDLQKFCGAPNPVHFIGLSHGEFVTAEKGKLRLKQYNRKGKFETLVVPEDSFVGEKGAVLDLTCDAKERIYVAGAGQSRIWVYTKKVEEEVQ